MEQYNQPRAVLSVGGGELASSSTICSAYVEAFPSAQLSHADAELSTSAQSQKVSFLADFLFEFDSYAFLSSGLSEHQCVIQGAQARFQVSKILVAGKKGQIGSAEYNLRLFEQRKKAVALSKECLAFNRRVEIFSPESI
ncbi:hypothetical protein [Vreelandella venusta]|uniref:Uncharacterized protein n=1 Tax=Vreelandella venusta TaxID=44935 RepID=A0AAP9ZDA2_9GAMM|nr:hypothetical protein [Halomonas venusta]QRL02644.1 hypothetical protein JDS37_15310 [Halomonas venusta]WAM47966.1 hypothetical protein L0521_14565 [Halomonas venusta]WAM54965.1 hypothetical protein L0519_14790 [Halomonas venusta]GEK52105.1 hypothetical protein HVE01_28260 [Halomonas venusta]